MIQQEQAFRKKAKSSLGLLATVVASALGLSPQFAQAGSIRIWPEAVIVDDMITLGDLCEFHGFDEKTERRLAAITIANAPDAGSNRILHLDMIRTVLAESGTNLATITFHGATRCTAARPMSAENPSIENPPANSKASFVARNTVPRDPSLTRKSLAHGSHEEHSASTLRKAVIHYFEAELARYNGRVEVIFDHTSKGVLNLAGPTYTFRVRHRKGQLLGLSQLDVAVVAEGQVVQTVPLVVQVNFRRNALSARRSISQGAIIRPEDVAMVDVVATRLDRDWLASDALVIGQRAKRYLPAGTLMRSNMLESVPLVKRGEIVTLTSRVGGIEVVTTGRASDEGHIGDTIRIRSTGKKRVEFDATVTGLGRATVTPVDSRVARTDKPEGGLTR